MIVNKLQRFLMTGKLLLIQLTIIFSLKNWILMVLEELQKTDSCLHEEEETNCSNWKWHINNSRNLSHNLIYNLNYHSVHTPPSTGGLNLQLNFQEGGLDRTSTFREGCWERGGDFFLGVVVQFSHKNKLKSEIFNDKKSL